MSRNWIIAGVAAVCLGVGIVLSHRLEPGVRIEKIILTTNTPALRIFPATLGPHPIALLAHGNGGSKEMLFRFGEAFAAAGFDCYSVDLAGYGESPQPWSLTNILLNFQESERALDPVDVFIGHSMGGGVGNLSVRNAGFRPKLFIGVGAPAKFGEQGPPVLLLFSRFDEFRLLFGLKALTNAQVVISPWPEHILEAYDPVLVRAAVKAACATVRKPAPAAPTAWRWRFAGLVLGIAGALGLMFRLPELHPRLVQARKFIVPAVLLIAILLTMGTWIGVTPQLRRIPQQLVLFVFIWLALAGLSRLRLPKWSLPVVTGILALACLALAFACVKNTLIWLFATFMCTFAISTLLLLPALAVSRIASRGGSRRDGDIAMAIFAGYVIGQFMPVFY
jgi:pimeloyl-ACP methyl ester carboxylesterase